MQFLGGKLSAAQLQVAGWVGSIRRSLQGALELVWGNTEEKQEEEEEDKDKDEIEESGVEEGRFQRAMSPLRSFARRSRRSLHRFSVRSQQTLQRRTTEACSAQVTSGEDKDTDALIDSEPDQQNGICEHTSKTGSPKPLPEHVPEVSSQDVDTTDLHIEPDFASFPESSAPLLDTSAQRSKADLSRRRSRTRPSRSLRLAQTKHTDEKEVSSKQEDSDSEEEQPKSKIVSPPPSSQRGPAVPAALIAQLKSRGAARGDPTEESKQREEKENQHEELASSPSQLHRSPRLPAHLAGAALVLPPLSGTDGGSVSSPAWLKELKSKKRLSQYDSET